MVPNQEGSFTVKYPENKVMRIYEAAIQYKKDKKDDSSEEDDESRFQVIQCTKS